MTDKLAIAAPKTGLAETASTYLAPVREQSKALTKPPLSLDKRISVKRRAKVGTDIDALIPSMAEEAKLLARHDPDGVEAVEVNRGFCVLINDPALMDVNVLFRFVAGSYEKPQGPKVEALAGPRVALPKLPPDH